MSLMLPHFVALDTSTLGDLTADYWSNDSEQRKKSRLTVDELKWHGTHVLLTHTQVEEFLRHGNSETFLNRIRFLRSLPLIAWIRPYTKEWMVGGTIDIYAREIESYLRTPLSTWDQIVKDVRQDLWETGTGSDMFGSHQEGFWLRMRQEYHRYVDHNRPIVSLTQIDYGVSDMTLEECRQAPKRAISELPAFGSQLMASMKRQIQQHGDKKWTQGVEDTIREFTLDTIERVRSWIEDQADVSHLISQQHDIPKEMITPDLTVGELGDLVVYAKRLALYQERMSLSRRLTVADIPIDTLPTYAFTRRLAAVQQRAERVSGSDLGDADIACVALYADRVGVDKRTFEFVSQIKRSNTNLATLVGDRCFKERDYSLIPSIVTGAR